LSINCALVGHYTKQFFSLGLALVPCRFLISALD